jgi:hypothetical protein
MNLKEIKEAALFFRDMAKKANVTIDKCLEMVAIVVEEAATERSTKDERLAVMDALREFVAANPEGAFDPRQVVVQVGLKQCQADRAFVRHHITKLRIASAA